MASTNKTQYYELSQYVSSDKPTYLIDYNGDMGKIDTGIRAAKTTADSASTAATNAATAAETAQSTATTAVTNAATAQTAADSANTKIGTLANLTTTAKTDLVSAINEIDSDVNTLNTTVTSTAQTVSNLVTRVGNVETELTPVELYTRDETTAYLPFTITIDLTDYEYLEIEVVKYGSFGETLTERINVGDTSVFFYADYDAGSGVRAWDRPIQVTTSSIIIGSCSINSTIDNLGLMPKKIIGYKKIISNNQ